MALLRIGDRYYGTGQYAKAVELYRQAMGKPGVDSSVANMHLGMALARSGDKAGATAAFNAVSGNLSGIAKYWLIYVQQQA
jgi:Flp pilus assembly protein TadD